MHSNRNWNQQQHSQEVDMTINGSAHSPVIPFLYHQHQLLLLFQILPHLPLKFLQAPFALLLLHQHLLSHHFHFWSSLCNSWRSRPTFSCIEAIVKRKFGSESVYCGNMWQSVLQTCSELNQIQTLKMLSILGKLNEDVSSLLFIELLLFVHYLLCMYVLQTNKQTHYFIYLFHNLIKSRMQVFCFEFIIPEHSLCYFINCQLKF